MEELYKEGGNEVIGTNSRVWLGSGQIASQGDRGCLSILYTVLPGKDTEPWIFYFILV